MPTGSYLMTSSFSYRKLKKLPSSDHEEEHGQQQPPPAATSIQDCYNSYYYRAVVARRRRRAWGRRRGGTRPRLRISSLARALRRKAAAVGARVRASVAKVAARLREGRPYIGDLFAGNYMFMQVAPSPTMTGSGLNGGDKGFVPFTEYYYGKVRSRPAMATGPPAAAAGVPQGVAGFH
ncbi:hypothetical protein PR202_ga08354 [Eleusine coracana subsp. coracana]|uniref:Uncharacterized protein n=1 Tax=Eleusine coracana subsp. coracana TaxID=191504 RepID=A0AAV5C116_ELECO|nr:hypothetical protein QOZ80_1AG0046070 [Eleusine coracana subsp. coracana]GJM91931.1 hypothetical protein PR202_ga08354 [Eleusine coracana subsp. coracana]